MQKVALWMYVLGGMNALCSADLIRADDKNHAYGSCRAKGQEALIDDMEDGDARINGSEGRLGLWYTFNPGGCHQTPLGNRDQRFVMTYDRSYQGNFVAATQANSCQGGQWSGGGLGFVFLSEDIAPGVEPIRCNEGYDASAFKGLTFALRASSDVRVQVCTKDVENGNCHGFNISINGDGWRRITVPWPLLVQEDWGPDTAFIRFNPARIVNVQFKSDAADFKIAVDNLKFFRGDGEGAASGGSGGKEWFAYKPQDVYADHVKTEYENWKARYLVVCNDGSADVRKGGTEAVSEGTGYGLLMSVSLDDRWVFDRLVKGFEKRRNARGLMSWQFEVCGGAWTEDAASDADLDIAMALIMADRKWGGYRYLAEPLIQNLKQHTTMDCDGRVVLRPGDRWGGCSDQRDTRLNPSYFSPAYYRVFASYLPYQADFWNYMTRSTYELMTIYQNSMGGLVPDWSYSNGGLAGGFGFEACRVPWRVATDYAWHGRSESARFLHNFFNYVNAHGGPSQAVFEKNSCFLGGMALSAIAQDQYMTNKWFNDWISNVPLVRFNPYVGDNPYYPGTLRVLYLLLAGGYLRW